MIYRQHFTPQCYELVHDAPAWITATGSAGMLIVNMEQQSCSTSGQSLC